MLFSKTNFSKGLKRWVILASALLIVALFAIIGVCSSPKLYIGYYAIPVSAQNALSNSIKTYLVDGKIKRTPVVVVLDDALSLRDALKKAKKCDILFSYNGRNLDETLAGNGVKKAQANNSEIYGGMTINMRKLAQYGGKDLAVPLLTDHFEIAYSWYWLNKAQKKIPETMVDLSAYIAACNKRSNGTLQWDIFLAAADPDALLQLTGAYVQSAYGIQACHALENAIREGKPFDAIVTEPLDADGHTLASVLNVFRDWATASLVHPQWTTFTLADVKQFMKADLAPIAFMPLSVHRTLDSETIVRYTASFFPVTNVNAPQYFTAPVICGVQFKKSAVIPKIFLHLASQDVQAALSMGTGLAPVNTRAVAPDRESDDVRYWTAATEPPYAGLDKAAFTTPTDRKAFAERIVAYINTPSSR